MLVLGVVLLLDALVTVVWQDPFTAVFAQHDQKALSEQLAATSSRRRCPPARWQLVEQARHTVRSAWRCWPTTSARDTKAGEPLGRIAIDRIDAKLRVRRRHGRAEPQAGARATTRATRSPGQDGTVAIAGHRTTYLAPFRHLDRLRRGRRITLTMPYGRFTYAVEGSRVVLPRQHRRAAARATQPARADDLHAGGQRRQAAGRHRRGSTRPSRAEPRSS